MLTQSGSYLREGCVHDPEPFHRTEAARGPTNSCRSASAGGDQSTGFREFIGTSCVASSQLPDGRVPIYTSSRYLTRLAAKSEFFLTFETQPAYYGHVGKRCLTSCGFSMRTELSSVWGEDETIGWVYQYFNSDEERRRNTSLNPRYAALTVESSLSVTNSSHPRYVVRFLTPTTRLGAYGTRCSQGEYSADATSKCLGTEIRTRSFSPKSETNLL